MGRMTKSISTESRAPSSYHPPETGKLKITMHSSETDEMYTVAAIQEASERARLARKESTASPLMRVSCSSANEKGRKSTP